MSTMLTNRDVRTGVYLGAAGMLMLAAAMGIGYWYGRSVQPASMLLDLNRVSTAASGTNMAVATGAVSDEAEGVFFLDFLTGDLQCLVYYPRSGAFGARYFTNIQSQLPSSGKSGQYLMVTGAAITNRTSSNMRPGNCLVYITDVSSGRFAAYTVPWNKSAESSSQAQLGSLVFVGGGPIRNYQINDAPPKKPAAAGGGPGKALKAPNDPNAPQDPNALAPNNAPAGGKDAGAGAKDPGAKDPADAKPKRKK